jgi:hypothetical protein
MNKRPKITFREATPGDIRELVHRLRQSDIDECEALFGRGTALEVTTHGLRDDGVAFMAVREGITIAVFGLCPGEWPGYGVPWMVGTNELDKCGRELMAEARNCLKIWHRFYPTLLNVVDARNTKSIRWLKRLGFTVREPVPMGMGGLPFHPFDRTI